MTTGGFSRRNALAGAATVGIGLPLLAACGGGSGTTANDTTGTTSSGSTSSGAPKPEPLATTTDIPVGGGTVFADQKVVVTQPAAGDFKGFTAICTHQGCTVANVEGGTINCPCHGSKFSIEDGAVEGGPAPSPLAEVQLKVAGGEISLA